MECRKIKSTEHCVFDTLEEFDDYFTKKGNLPPDVMSDWRTAPEGSWVWSDDGRIVQILRHGKSTPPSKTPDWVRTIVGVFSCSKHYTMDTDFSQHLNKWNFSKRKTPRTEDELHVQERAFVHYVIACNDPIKAVKMAVPGLTDKQAKNRTHKLLTQERIIMAIKREVSDAAAKAGVSVEYIFKQLKEAVDGIQGILSDAESDEMKLEAIKAKTATLKTLAEYMDMKPDQKSYRKLVPVPSSFSQIGDREVRELENTAPVGLLEEAEVISQTEETEETDDAQDTP